MPQPIETAPKDGTVFVAVAADNGWFSTASYYRAKWCETRERWVAYFGPDDWQPLCGDPTHWHPLEEGMPMIGCPSVHRSCIHLAAA